MDLALLWGCSGLQDLVTWPAQRRTLIAQPTMRWIASASVPWQPQSGQPLPLIAFDRPCLFLRCATDALDRAGIAWRIAFTSPSLGGLWAAA